MAEPSRNEADGDDTVAIPAEADVRADDRLATIELRRSMGQRLRTLIPVALVSAGIHVLVLATVFLLSKAPEPAAAPQETAIEVVEEPSPEKSKEIKPAARQAEEASRQEPPVEPPQEAKRDEPKEQPKQETKQEPQAEEQRQAPSKQEAKLDTSSGSKGAEPPPKPDAEDLARLQALQDELATLKAQQGDLEAQAHAEAQAQAEAQAKAEAQAEAKAAAQARTQAVSRTKALGLLPESFAAVTMPPVSPTGDDPVSYQQVVYSLVTRAKRSGQAYMQGVAHVVFEIDDKGALTRVTVDRSSGNPAVDKEAIALIRRAAPFPPPPAGAPRSFPSYMSFVPDP